MVAVIHKIKRAATVVEQRAGLTTFPVMEVNMASRNSSRRPLRVQSVNAYTSVRIIAEPLAQIDSVYSRLRVIGPEFQIRAMRYVVVLCDCGNVKCVQS